MQEIPESIEKIIVLIPPSRLAMLLLLVQSQTRFWDTLA